MVIEEVFLLYAKDFESLFFGHEFATDPETLRGHFTLAFPLWLLRVSCKFFLPELAYFFSSCCLIFGVNLSYMPLNRSNLDLLGLNQTILLYLRAELLRES